MNKYLIFFLISSLQLSHGIVEAQWKLEKSPTGDNLNAISFTAGSTGWIVGNRGTILSRTDKEWVEIQKPTTENLRSIYMLDKTNGWAVGDNGTIIHYDGTNWKSYPCPTAKDLLSVFFKDPDNGIAVGELGTILIYHRGLWSVMKNNIKGDLFTGFFNNDDVWIGGGLECIDFAIRKMSYGSGVMSPVTDYKSMGAINSICLLSPDNGWAVGSPGILLHFDGIQWEKAVINDEISSLRSVFFSDEKKGISAGYGGTLLVYSADKWTREKSGTTRNLNGTAITGNTYYAVGDAGTIISGNPGNKDITGNNTEEMTEKIEAYPNPCDEIISFKIPGENLFPKMKVSVTNSNGQVFLQKEYSNLDGNQENQIFTSGLKNGLYFLQADTGSELFKTKIIVLH